MINHDKHKLPHDDYMRKHDKNIVF